MITGVIVALLTPFTFDNDVNYDVLDKMLDHHLKCQTDGILLFGTTGESEALSIDEQVEIIKFTLKKLKGRIPLMVGVTSNITHTVMEKIDIFEEYDIDSYLVITPYYNKTNESGMIKHFQMIADYSNKPIVIYNVPKRTGISITMNAIEVLSLHPNIKGIKEASGDLEFQTRIKSIVNDEFYLYGGDDCLMLPSLSIGAKGIISVVANLYPDKVKDIIDSYECNPANARKIFMRYYHLFSDCFLEVSPIPIKYLMNQKGFLVGKCRMPYGELSFEHKMKLLDSLNNIDEPNLDKE